MVMMDLSEFKAILCRRFFDYPTQLIVRQEKTRSFITCRTIYDQ